MYSKRQHILLLLILSFVTLTSCSSDEHGTHNGDSLVQAQSVESLIPSLHDPDKHVRLAAMRELRGRGDKRAVRSLIEVALRDRDEGVAFEAIQTLNCLIRDLEYAKFLLQALRDPFPQQRISALEQVRIRNHRLTIDIILIMLRDPSAEVAVQAERELHRIGDNQVVEACIDALSDIGSSIRQLVAETLGRFGGSRAKEALEQARLSAIDENRLEDQRVIESALQHIESSSQ